jgi:hypothetical protein
VSQALTLVEKESDTLAHALDQLKQERQAAAQLAQSQFQNELQQTAAAKQTEVAYLQHNLAKPVS